MPGTALQSLRLPLLQIGAPWVDFRVSREACAAGWPGVLFREAYFTPTSSKHAGKMCGGVQVGTKRTPGKPSELLLKNVLSRVALPLGED